MNPFAKTFSFDLMPRRSRRREFFRAARLGFGAANTVAYGGLNSNKGKSPGLWGGCPIADILEGKDPSTNGIFTHLDFRRFKTSANVNATVAYWDQGCNLYGSDGAALAVLDEINGGLTISSDGDNEGVAIQQVCLPFQISRAHKRLWFEARVKFSTIADTKFGAFIGLGDAMTIGATVPIAAAGTLADENLVGWHRLEGDGDAADTVYKANTVTQVSVQTDAATLVADTWIKLGFLWDSADKAGPNILSFYADGVRCSTTYTMASADGTDFPNDVRLAPLIALLNATATTPGSMSISDLWCAQLL